MSIRAHNAGAALVIALAVFAILLSIGVTFLAMTRMEVKSSSNVEAAGQAELVADAGVAQAMSVLNQDRIEHPDVTSTDHAWSTYFNGAWLAGKGWAFRGGNGAWFNDPLNIPYLRFDLCAADDPSLLVDRTSLFVPRFEDIYVPAQKLKESSSTVLATDNPFVIANDPADSTLPQTIQGLLPAQQIARWADVDNDGDGLKDSMWLPMAADTFANDDGIDNDLDGDPTKTPEVPVFVYWGGADGLDNNGNGIIDEKAEEKWFFTVPLFGVPIRVVDNQGNPLDVNGNPISVRGGIYRNAVTGQVLDPAPVMDTVTIPDTASIVVKTTTGTVTLTNKDVDAIDNDYSGIINDFDIVARRAKDWTLNEPRRYHEIAYDYLKNLSLTRSGTIAANLTDGTNATAVKNAAPSDIVSIQCTGEPVCELVGRYAVLIRDESSKVNINVAGAMSYDDRTTFANADGHPLPDPSTDTLQKPYKRALNTGLGAHEYDTRVIPKSTSDTIGQAEASHLAAFRNGADLGRGLSWLTTISGEFVTPALLTSPSSPLNPYVLDGSLPGYGMADDNSNALWMTMDGVDNDGDGLIDEGLNPGVMPTDPEPGNSTASEKAAHADWVARWDLYHTYQSLLGCLEGVDEPQEYLASNPKKNTLALNDAVLNPPDQPLRSMSDTRFRSEEELVAVSGIGEPTAKLMAPFVTASSVEKNLAQNPDAPISKPKIDFNYGTAKQIAEAFIGQGYASNAWPVRNLPQDALAFARGLKQGEDSLFIPQNAYWGILNGNVPETTLLPADPALRAMQMAVNIVDNRDEDYERTTLTNTQLSDLTPEQNEEWIDQWWDSANGINQKRPINYTAAGVEAIRINEVMVRPVRRIEAEMAVTEGNFYPNYFSRRDASNNVSVPDFDAGPYATSTALGATHWSTYGMFVGEYASVQTADGPYMVSNRSNYERIPDIVQFRFRASPGLPPGRYYLMANMTVNGLAGTTTQPKDRAPNFLYAIKYMSSAANGALPAVTTTILDDVASIVTTIRNSGVPQQVLPVLMDYFDQNWLDLTQWPDPQAFIGGEGASGQGAPTGLVFLPDRQIPPQLDGYRQPALGKYRGAGRLPADSVNGQLVKTGTAFPVEIREGEDLLVAFCANPRTVDPARPETYHIAINYFDFSQAPDHQYVELTNISDKPVDIAGWQLGVGYGPSDPNGLIMTVPKSDMVSGAKTPVLVVPGGSVLLVTNKFDEAKRTVAGQAIPAKHGYSPFYSNGIGMARGPVPVGAGAANWYTDVTVPPTIPYVPGSSATYPNIVDEFTRDLITDFVDRLGNGSPDYTESLPLAACPDDEVQSSGTDGFDWPSETLPPAPPTYPKKAWDRIIELDDINWTPPGMVPVAGMQEAATTAYWVLRGGIFPNYPEHDGIDNDGDNATLTTDGLNNNGDVEVLIQRDAQNRPVLDAQGRYIPILDGNGNVQPIVQANQLLANIDEPYEGVDEGRFRMEGGRLAMAVLAGGSVSSPAEGSPGGYNLPPVYINNFILLTLPGAPPDLPDWKAFVERRSFPGDCVMVTLYEGDAKLNRIVDRVTYTEQDVVNRAIDDVRPCPYLSGAVSPTLNGVVNSSFWPNNTMCVDFYRALERKHPLLAGDRFGTQNRWEATDGNYDDWAPATSMWYYDPPSTDPLDRRTLANAGLYLHCFNGSPLRMNYTARIMENPLIDPERPGLGRQFPEPAITDYERHIRWAFDNQTPLRNAHYLSTGDVLGTSAFTTLTALWPARAQRSDIVNGVHSDLLGNSVDTDAGALKVLVGQQARKVADAQGHVAVDPVLDLRTAAGRAFAMNPLELACGQAKFTSILPGAPSATTVTDHSVWTTSGGAPDAWMPVASFAFGGEKFNFDYSLTAVLPNAFYDGTLNQHVFLQRATSASSTEPPLVSLFNEDPSGTPSLFNARVFQNVLTATGDRVDYVKSRSAVETRPVMFVAASRDAAVPQPEALFEWTADAGLEPGTYDAYVVTCADPNKTNWAGMSPGLLARDPGNTANPDPILNGPNGLFGRATDAAVSHNVKDMWMDIRFFTKKDDVAPFDSATPDWSRPNSEGVIYYAAGPIKITEDRYLALRIRNSAQTPTNRLNQFTRIVLTPRPRVPGMININTAETRWVMDTDAAVPKQLFNPLLGVPGMLGCYTYDNDPTVTVKKPLLQYPPAPDDSLKLMEAPDPATTASLFSLFKNNVGKDRTFSSAEDTKPRRMEALYDRVCRIMARRTENWDGRYYANLGDLMLGYGTDVQSNGQLRYPLFPDWDTPSAPAINLEWQLDDNRIFNESLWRFDRMANLVNTRSDVFEITVTAQAGYGVDTNSVGVKGTPDGVINWRDDEEFKVTAEKKVRTVYERPEPRQIK